MEQQVLQTVVEVAEIFQEFMRLAVEDQVLSSWGLEMRLADTSLTFDSGKFHGHVLFALHTLLLYINKKLLSLGHDVSDDSCWCSWDSEHMGESQHTNVNKYTSDTVIQWEHGECYVLLAPVQTAVESSECEEAEDEELNESIQEESTSGETALLSFGKECCSRDQKIPDHNLPTGMNEGIYTESHNVGYSDSGYLVGKVDSNLSTDATANLDSPELNTFQSQSRQPTHKILNINNDDFYDNETVGLPLRTTDNCESNPANNFLDDYKPDCSIEENGLTTDEENSCALVINEDVTSDSMERSHDTNEECDFSCFGKVLKTEIATSENMSVPVHNYSQDVSGNEELDDDDSDDDTENDSSSVTSSSSSSSYSSSSSDDDRIKFKQRVERAAQAARKAEEEAVLASICLPEMQQQPPNEMQQQSCNDIQQQSCSAANTSSGADSLMVYAPMDSSAGGMVQFRSQPMGRDVEGQNNMDPVGAAQNTEPFLMSVEEFRVAVRQMEGTVQEQQRQLVEAAAGLCDFSAQSLSGVLPPEESGFCEGQNGLDLESLQYPNVSEEATIQLLKCPTEATQELVELRMGNEMSAHLRTGESDLMGNAIHGEGDQMKFLVVNEPVPVPPSTELPSLVPLSGANARPDLSCPMCGKHFNRRIRMKCHMRIHTGERPFKCTQCDRTFTASVYLQQHRTICQKKQREFQCKLCQKGFGQKSALVMHLATHASKKPFTCDVCNQSFALKFTLTTHQAQHTGTRPWSCSVCGRAFITKYKLKSHMKAHTGELVCNVCAQTFTSQDSYGRHIRIHQSREQQVPLPTCQICGKVFATPSLLRRHSKTHERSSFQCVFCDKQLPTHQKLTAHQRSHSANQPILTCPRCQKTFGRSSDLDIHLASVCSTLIRSRKTILETDNRSTLSKEEKQQHEMLALNSSRDLNNSCYSNFISVNDFIDVNKF